MSRHCHSWAEDLAAMLDFAWQRIIRGVHDRHAAARHPTLATVSVQGWPQARTVVLRKAYRSSARLEIHTNLYSTKVSELRAMPVAALHVWDAGCRLQTHLSADVIVCSGNEVRETWAALPDHSRSTFSSRSIPGSSISESLAYEAEPDPNAFAIVYLDIQTIDLLYLGSQHRRARFKRDNQWIGSWVCP
jgi:pyridoxine/pyridoxamine 5'-phosphate oxidase